MDLAIMIPNIRENQLISCSHKFCVPKFTITVHGPLWLREYGDVGVVRSRFPAWLVVLTSHPDHNMCRSTRVHKA